MKPPKVTRAQLARMNRGERQGIPRKIDEGMADCRRKILRLFDSRVVPPPAPSEPVKAVVQRIEDYVMGVNDPPPLPETHVLRGLLAEKLLRPRVPPPAGDPNKAGGHGPQVQDTGDSQRQPGWPPVVLAALDAAEEWAAGYPLGGIASASDTYAASDVQAKCLAARKVIGGEPPAGSPRTKENP